MGYKHRESDLAQVRASLEAPNFLLKIIPHVDGSPRICEVVEYSLENADLKGAWTGPAWLKSVVACTWRPWQNCQCCRWCRQPTSLRT